ncbi:MerR family transcriptional regulator [Risungbinella massiliensis]|uniref:MerR family transcriptional regulator n=1 Tax=Risungbinella massiliensis TaxID=1329796 RepID=UPI0005CBAA6E|nr:MerR family transcriptional regulator [Risungbinella massiliensis]
MNISEVAERTGLSAHTIRFYERSGLFPKIKRSKNGIREFTDSDVHFLKFLVALKKTGMSLDEIAEFTKDGCILESLESGEMPKEPVNHRLSILKEHQKKLIEQQRELELLHQVVTQKISFYERYVKGTEEKEKEDFQDD